VLSRAVKEYSSEMRIYYYLLLPVNASICLFPCIMVGRYALFRDIYSGNDEKSIAMSC